MWIPVKIPKMQGITFKFGERRDEWKCCFCCHVRTATIFLGVWHLLLHMLTLSLLSVFLRHPEPPVLPTPLSSELNFSVNSSPNTYDRSAYLMKSSSEYQHFSIVVVFSTLAITLLMVYGAIKGKPSYLMPFFCLQLFDFCISCLTALTYVGFLPDVHRMVANSPHIPMREQLLRLSPESLAFLVLLTFLSAMLVKAYFIGVVWSCYKYLTLRLVSAQRTLHLIETESAQDLLPNYDSVITKFPPPPPPYSQAINHPTA